MIKFTEFSTEGDFKRIIHMACVGDPDDEVPPHQHNFDHYTSVLKGKAKVSLETDGVVTDYVMDTDSEPMLIPTDALHSALPLVDGTTMQCRFFHRDIHGNPEVIEDRNGAFARDFNHYT